MKNSGLFQDLHKKLESLEKVAEPRIVGTVIAYGDGVVRVEGLDNVQAGELIDLGNNELGLALNLEANSVGIVTLGNAAHLSVGDSVYGTGRILSIGVSDEILGRVVDPLGRTLDGKGELKVTSYEALEKIAYGVMARQSVSQPLQTGVKAIDAMIPVGRGQRELIIGDRGTGKSSIALGTILNQMGENVVCIYVAIGQKRSFLAQTVTLLEERGALDYTVFVSASASESAAAQFLAPFAGVAIAEHFMKQGRDVLVVYDDLSKHAVAYREISLLLRRPSGREAYPGDVFYLHSRLLERAARLNKEHGGGSITALPIIETQANDVSAFIPTNVISITDGQIYLETDLFNAGVRPAINVGLSVSRVGGAAQIKAMKQVAGQMKLDLAQYRELEAFAQFSSDLDAVTKRQLDRGERTAAILNQGWDTPLSVQKQVAIIWAAVKGKLDTMKVSAIRQWEIEFLEYLEDAGKDILESIVTEQKLIPETESALEKLVQTFNDLHPEWTIAGEE